MPGLFGVWQGRIGREASLVRLRRMTTRWGTCNTRTGAITLNVALAEYRPEMLEYVVVHELVHLWERGHGPAFTARMDAHLPDWRSRKAALRGAA
ncbi:M48 family metallopeptidase [Tessaracoccus sp. HDW20]|nr:M48 family metallopeptidase [Tessaracoccus coleopterorum]